MGGKPRFAGFFVIATFLVIVFEIDFNCVAFGPSECDPPVSAGFDRVAALVTAAKRMKPKARQVHVVWTEHVVQGAQNIGDTFGVLYTEQASIARLEKSLPSPCL
jgi:hypothetical protein